MHYHITLKNKQSTRQMTAKCFRKNTYNSTFHQIHQSSLEPRGMRVRRKKWPYRYLGVLIITDVAKDLEGKGCQVQDFNCIKENHVPQRCGDHRNWMLNPKKANKTVGNSTTLLPFKHKTHWVSPTSYSVAQGGRPRRFLGPTDDHLWSAGYVLSIPRILIEIHPWKTNMTLEIKSPIFNRKYIFIHGCFSSVMLVFGENKLSQN